MDDENAQQHRLSPAATIALVAEMYEMGVTLYRERMIREHGPVEGERLVREWLADYDDSDTTFRRVMPPWPQFPQ